MYYKNRQITVKLTQLLRGHASYKKANKFCKIKQILTILNGKIFLQTFKRTNIMNKFDLW